MRFSTGRKQSRFKEIFRRVNYIFNFWSCWHKRCVVQREISQGKASTCTLIRSTPIFNANDTSRRGEGIPRSCVSISS